MSKFTPGPWEVEYDPDSEGHVICMGTSLKSRGHYEAQHIIEYNHDLIPFEDGLQFAEAEANAYLIAAAPDLYEALKEVFSLLEEHEPQWYLRGHCNRIKAALEKADGKE